MLIFLIIGWCVPSYAIIYIWTDEAGVKYFSDHLPPGVENYKVVESIPHNAEEHDKQVEKRRQRDQEELKRIEGDKKAAKEAEAQKKQKEAEAALEEAKKIESEESSQKERKSRRRKVRPTPY